MKHQNMSKNILILGAGGHGTVSLQKLFELEQCSFEVVFHTADWGGSQGLWGRLLKLGDYFLDKKLNGKQESFLPFGDPNKLLNFYSQQLFPDLEFFDLRSSNYITLKEKSEEFLKIIKADSEFQVEFLDYLSESFEFFVTNRKKLNFKREFCVGYAFHSFVLKKVGSVANWNKYYKEVGILPQNINLSFAYNERTVMVGKDISLVKLVGEDKIDHHDNPILPDSIHLSSTRTKKPITELNELLAKIDQSDCIIIPSGSITNWVSILNLEGVAKVLKSKQLIWLTNPYKSRNELDNLDYLDYFKSIGIEPIILKSKKDTKLVSKFVLDLNRKGRYDGESLREMLRGIIFGLV